MNTLNKRILLFLIGCVGLRSLIAYIAKCASANLLAIMGYLAILPAIGFAYIFITGARKTGNETFGAPIWWNMLRPIHSALYMLFAWNAINGNRKSWMYLMADVILGLVAFLWKHSTYLFSMV